MVTYFNDFEAPAQNGTIIGLAIGIVLWYVVFYVQSVLDLYSVTRYSL